LALAVPLSRFTPRVGGGSAFFVRTHGDTLMNIPTSKKETLEKMYQIVRQDSWDSRDMQPIRELLDLANHS